MQILRFSRQSEDRYDGDIRSAYLRGNSIIEIEEYLRTYQKKYEGRPDDRVHFAGVHGIVHIVPATKLLFGAVYGKRGAIDSRYRHQDIVLGERILPEEVIDDGDIENSGPEIRK